MLAASFVVAAGLAANLCPAEIHTDQAGKDVPAGWTVTQLPRKRLPENTRRCRATWEPNREIVASLSCE